METYANTGSRRAMSCPECGGSLRVVNLMVIKDKVTHSETLRRYRICKECGRRVTTDEKVVGADAAYVDALEEIRTHAASVVNEIERLEHGLRPTRNEEERE